MKILITGAGGFIGSHLVESQLEKGNVVKANDLHFERLAHLTNHPGLELILGDIADPKVNGDLLSGVEVVYHLASAHLDVSLSDEYYRQVNVGGTMELLIAAQRAGLKRFVHCSSVGVIGDVKDPPADETSPCKPLNIYERTKLEGERTALEFARQNALPFVVARPAWVYGPRCPRTEKLFRMIAKGRFIFFGNGRNLRHPIYITDAIQGLELCAQSSQADGEVYIIAGNEPVMVKDLVGMISQEIGVQFPTIHLPLFFGKWIGIVFEKVYKPLGKQPPFSRRSIDFFQKDNAYDIRKAKGDLDFNPQVDLVSGIRKTLKYLNGNYFQ